MRLSCTGGKIYIYMHLHVTKMSNFLGKQKKIRISTHAYAKSGEGAIYAKRRECRKQIKCISKRGKVLGNISKTVRTDEW